MPFAVIVLIREKLHGQGPCRLQLGLYMQHQAVKCLVGRQLVTPFATSLPVHSGQVGEGTVSCSDVDSGFPLQRNLGHSGAKAKILALFSNSA